MGDGPIQPIIQPITIDTMLNNNGLSIGDGLNSLRVNRPLMWKIIDRSIELFWQLVTPHLTLASVC